MEYLDSLQKVIDDYDAYLLDLWGVIHDGTAAYPESIATLEELKSRGKKVIFISNAPRRAAKAEKVLAEVGVDASLYSHVVTSGEIAYAVLREQELDPGGMDYYFIGPERDADVLDGLPFTAVDNVDNAQFLLNVGFGSEEQSTDDWKSLLAKAAEKKLPMLCLNPDMEVVKITGERFPCAGVIAQAYRKLDGEVLWFGKPYPAIYETCMSLVSDIDSKRIIAIGDSLHTDVLGARKSNLDAILVTGGIMKTKLAGKTPEELDAFFKEEDIKPDFIMDALRH